MAFLAGLMGAVAGRRTREHDDYKDALAQTAADKAFMENQRRWEIENKRADDLAQSQISNNNALASERTEKSKQIAAMLKGTDPKTAAYIERLRAQAGDDAALAVLRKSQTWLNYQRPKMANDLISSRERIARAHDSAAFDRNMASIRGRMDLAKYNDKAKEDIVRLAASFRSKDVDENNAVRMAIAQLVQSGADYRSLLTNNARIYDALNNQNTNPGGSVDYGTVQGMTGGYAPNVTYNMGPQMGGVGGSVQDYVQGFQQWRHGNAGGGGAGNGGSGKGAHGKPVKGGGPPRPATLTQDDVNQLMSFPKARRDAILNDPQFERDHPGARAYFMYQEGRGTSQPAPSGNQPLPPGGFINTMRPPGGSNVRSPFDLSRIHPANAQEQSDLAGNVAPQLDAMLGVAAQLGHTINLSAVREGGHIKNSYHYKGMAADISGVDGVDIGENPQTIQFIANMIMNNPFVKGIGTLASIAAYPPLQRLARDHGIRLFTDDSHGHHVHLSLGPG